MKPTREYAVYSRKDDRLLMVGSEVECTRSLGVSMRQFKRMLSEDRGRYIVEDLGRAKLSDREKAVREPRRDCFALRNGRCCALNETYCMWEDCGFYRRDALAPKNGNNAGR